MFRKYHYLNYSHNNAARVFVATANEKICGFCSVLHFPHAKTKKIKKCHRLVVLPDFQGIGIGGVLLNKVGEIVQEEGNRFTIVTSAPGLVNYLKKSDKWICTFYGRKKETSKKGVLRGKTSKNRVVTSFEMK